MPSTQVSLSGVIRSAPRDTSHPTKIRWYSPKLSISSRVFKKKKKVSMCELCPNVK